MKLIKLKGFRGSLIYINPLNISAVGVYGYDDKSKTWIEMIGNDDDHYYTVEQPLEEVVKLIENCEVK